MATAGDHAALALAPAYVPPLAWGLYALVFTSILFEPMRIALWRLGDEVGGVGGVGGLTNQFAPVPTCKTVKSGPHVTEEYCFRPGVLGFTPFASFMLTVLVVPLGLAALASHRFASRRAQGFTPPSNEVLQNALDSYSVIAFKAFWAGASSLWFLVPFVYFVSSPYYQKNAYFITLAVSIAAAYPLSWHLSFVSIPSSGASYLAPLLGTSLTVLKECHVSAAWATLFWGIVHAVGELVFLTSQRELDLLSLKPTTDIDNLTFIFGLVLLAVLLIHSSYALLRYHRHVANSFRAIHGVLARVLLLIATAHWWPFVFFLAPATAIAATGRAINTTLKGERPDVIVRYASLALAAAIAATIVGIVTVWAIRQAWMLAHPFEYYTLPVNVFPPAAVALAYVLARLAAGVALQYQLKVPLNATFDAEVMPILQAI